VHSYAEAQEKQTGDPDAERGSPMVNGTAGTCHDRHSIAANTGVAGLICDCQGLNACAMVRRPRDHRTIAFSGVQSFWNNQSGSVVFFPVVVFRAISDVPTNVKPGGGVAPTTILIRAPDDKYSGTGPCGP
jgi:hypothetical protein